MDTFRTLFYIELNIVIVFPKEKQIKISVKNPQFIGKINK
ncbi:hypothetical protein BACCIP111883_00330 [Sutcliffiella rhizosphaerae]|uniref:Uncharacterized protein n=1 Tax=Sutcliffiella rhizosphaerae TaxID=2880967 RepID=A0ABN8A6N0_9BACI|nr:hypothetical protein BACCIP111883_00330 [Sutcliffiella rhizosphaerae]